MLPQIDRPGTLEKVITLLRAIRELVLPFDTPDPWHVAKLSPNWLNLSYAGNPQAGYMKDPLGRVHLRGVVVLPGTFSAIFQLPPDYRPAHTIYFADGLIIQPDGIVTDTGAFTVHFLNGVNFDTRP